MSSAPVAALGETPPPRDRAPAWRTYSLAIAIALAAVLVRVALAPWLGAQPVLILFLVPIIIASYIGGFGPGLLATAIAAAGAKFFFLPVTLSFAFGSWLDFSLWAILLTTGVLVSALSEALHRARRKAETTTRDLAQAQATIAKSEHRFRALVERGSDSIALIAPDNRISYVSPAVANVEGYTPEELVGRNGMEHTHPDDLPYVARIVEQLIAQPGKPIPVLWRRRHKQGHWVWLEGFATNLLADPAVGAIVTNYRDVTERKLTEQKLRAQLEQLALLHRITRATGERQDLHSILQVVVRSLEENLPVDFGCVCRYTAPATTLTVACVGTKSETLALSLAMPESAVVPIDENGLSRCVRGTLVYEPDVTEIAFPFPQRLARGGLRSLVAAPLIVENQVFGVLLVARHEPRAFTSGECEFLKQLSEHVALAAHQADLRSSLQNAYDELRETQQAVAQQERLRALGQMASGVAHDINNALTPAVLYVESLLTEEPDVPPTVRDQLTVVQHALEDITQTVARMGEFYRQREPQAVLKPVDATRLLGQVVELTRARWSDMPQQRGTVIDLRVETSDGLPPVMGLESEMREALINLVFNAVDAMPDGGVLTLRALGGESGNASAPLAPRRHVSIEVADTGVGMSEDTRQRCLEPFFTTKGERGTGLGLAMVYGIAKRHVAELSVESSVGCGTTIRLRFATPTPEDALRATRPTPSAPLACLRLLIVDDDPVLLRALRDILQADGHLVISANDGRAGIAAFSAAQLRNEPFSAVITDLGMPHTDGRKVAAAIKAASPATPVILLTGWGRRIADENDIPTHVDHVLGKPPKIGEIREALARCLEAGAARS